MIYIQLATPIREFNKVRIKEISFFDTNGESNLDKALGFKYQVYKKNDNELIPLYDKYVNIINQKLIDIIIQSKNPDLSAYDFICSQLLQHLVTEQLEIGTIEVE